MTGIGELIRGSLDLWCNLPISWDSTGTARTGIGVAQEFIGREMTLAARPGPMHAEQARLGSGVIRN